VLAKNHNLTGIELDPQN